LDIVNDRVVLFRTAKSKYSKVCEDKSWQHKNPAWDRNYIDSQLCSLGRKQCETAAAYSHKLLPDLQLIIVSPLHRALETAYLIFKDHPNFKKIKVVVDPNLRE